MQGGPPQGPGPYGQPPYGGAMPQGYGAPGYSPPAQPPQNGPEFEFGPQESAIIARTGGRSATWGILMFVFGALWILGGVIYLGLGVVGAFAGKGGSGPLILVGAVIQALILFLFGAIGAYLGNRFFKAGKLMKEVAHSQGRDVTNLMGALDALGSALMTQIVVTVIYIALTILGVLAVAGIAAFKSKSSSKGYYGDYCSSSSDCASYNCDYKTYRCK